MGRLTKSNNQIEAMIQASRLTGHNAERHGPLPSLIERPYELQAVVEDLAKDYIDSWRPGKKAFKREIVHQAKYDAFFRVEGKPMEAVNSFFIGLKNEFDPYKKELKKDGQLYKSFKILQGKINTNAQLGAQDFKKAYNKIEDFLRLFPGHEQVAKFEEMPATASCGYGGGSSSSESTTATSMAASGKTLGKSTNPFFNTPTSGGSTATNTANLGRGASSKGLNPFGNTPSSGGEAASAFKQQPVSGAFSQEWDKRNHQDPERCGNYDIDKLFGSDNR